MDTTYEEGSPLPTCNERSSIVPNASHDETEELEGILDELSGKYQVMAMCALGLANAADSAEMMVISFIMPELDQTETMKGILSGSMFAGMLVGGLVSGIVADRIGRKPCLLAFMVLNFVFGVAVAAFPHLWYWIFACEILAGVGVGGTIPVMFTMAAEIPGPKYRGKLISGVCSFWMFGGLYTAGASWLIIGHYKYHWKYAAFASQLPNFTAAILIALFLDETAKFHVVKGNYAAASKVLQNMAWWNGIELAPYTRKDQAAADVNSAGQCGPYGAVPVPDDAEVKVHRAPGATNPCQGIGDMFAPQLRKVSWAITIMWATLSFGWYGIILWIPKLFKSYDAGFSTYEEAFMVQAANLPGNILAILLIDRVGRNRLLSISMFGSSAICLVMGFQHSLEPIVVLACAYNGVSIIGWSCLSCVTSESFPTYLRSTAVGFLSGTGRVASGLSQVAFGLMFHYDMPVSVILFTAAGTMSIGALSALYLYCDSVKCPVAADPVAPPQRGTFSV